MRIYTLRICSDKDLYAQTRLISMHIAQKYNKMLYVQYIDREREGKRALCGNGMQTQMHLYCTFVAFDFKLHRLNKWICISDNIQASV